MARKAEILAEPRVFQEALEVLHHLRGIRVARKAQHQVAERIDQIDVIARRTLGRKGSGIARTRARDPRPLDRPRAPPSSGPSTHWPRKAATAAAAIGWGAMSVP